MFWAQTLIIGTSRDDLTLQPWDCVVVERAA